MLTSWKQYVNIFNYKPMLSDLEHFIGRVALRTAEWKAKTNERIKNTYFKLFYYWQVNINAFLQILDKGAQISQNTGQGWRK